MPTYCYEQNGSIVPVSALDNFLIMKDFNNYKITFYSIFDGTELNTKISIDTFYSKVIENSNKNIYETTDHLIYSILIDGVNFLYVSLDNSVRSNMNKLPLAHTRLENLMKVVSNIINKLDKCVVFFSESCRPSFYGNINERQDERSWVFMRETIQNNTGLYFLTEKRNNEDSSGLSFGISVWYNHHAKICLSVSNYFNLSILDKGFGSVAIGVKLSTGNII